MDLKLDFFTFETCEHPLIASLPLLLTSCYIYPLKSLKSLSEMSPQYHFGAVVVYDRLNQIMIDNKTL